MENIRLGRVDVVREHVGREQVVRAVTPFEPRFETLQQMLRRNAREFPDRVFLKEPVGDAWRELTYEQAEAATTAIAAGLLARSLSRERPLAILSGNGIDHAVLSLAAMSVGIPVAPISSAYSQFQDLSRLRAILEALTPGLVYADDGAGYANALALARDLGNAVLVSRPASDAQSVATLAELSDGGADADAASREQKVGGDTLAKILFTSGSTGTPKGVMVTQRMMCSNQDALAQVWRFLDDEPPVLVDWLPWNHIYGGCLNFNLILRNAGTLVIDDGRPMPGRMPRTLQHLRDARPTIYMGVPRALGELARALADDLEPERASFSRMRVVYSAGAALPEATWQALQAGCERATGRKLAVFIGWGSTETAPLVSITRPECTRADSIGLPIPGAEIKLVPNQDKLELRVRGPMVTPGYWRAPDLTTAAFDADGFYAIGDAGRIDETHWQRDGIVFDGRVAENFKLLSGTWVSVGPLRLTALAAGAPLFDEVVVTGHDRDEVGLLVFPNLAACRALAGRDDAVLADLIDEPAVRAAVAQALKTLCRGGGSSTQARRALLLTTPPSMETGEMTDKGYLNQRAALQCRAESVKRLYAEPRHPAVVLAEDA